MINPCQYFSLALLLLFSSTHAYSTRLAIGSMNITHANSVGIGGGGTGQVQFDIDAFYIGPNTNLVGGYIGSGGAGFASDELNPDSIIAFDFAGEIAMVYTAAANLGDSGAGPNSEQLPGTIDGGVVPFGTLDATADTISMDLSSWFINFRNTDLHQGTANTPPTTSEIATGTWNSTTLAYTLNWQAQVPGGPFDGGTVVFWTLQGYASPVPVPAAFWLFGTGIIGLIGIARKSVPSVELTC